MHLALLDLDRSRRLLDRGYAPQARVDIDSTRVETADAAIKAAAAQVVESGSAIDGAKARVAELEANLSDMQIYSPRTARVLFRLAEPGEVLSAGGRVFLLVDLDDLTMTVYVGEAQAGQVRVGDAARIRLDALPEHLIDATVSFIAAEAEFTPKEVETAEERQKLVFRVKLRVADNKDRLIKPGMPGVGYIRTDPSASWPETLP
jgi:HlyD family secretion protein